MADTIGQTLIDNTLHIQLKIEEHELRLELNPGAPSVASVVLLLNDMNIVIWVNRVGH